ncbi:DUF2573 family protein [Paenibacillus alvei]
MDKEFLEKFDSLLSKYTELLLGEGNDHLKKEVEIWMLYNQMAKSMPSLVKHWNGQFPEAKQQVVNIISEIKNLNDNQKQNKN